MGQDFDTVGPSPAQPQPFSPSSPQRPGAGCSRPALIGCGLLILLLGIGAVVFLLKAKDLFDWTMTQFEEQVLASLAEDVSDEERARLSKAFAAASEAVKESRADASALQQLQQELRELALQEGQELSRDDVSRLTTVLERVATEARDHQPESSEPLLNQPQESSPPASPPN
jgi:hypothetical protein